MKLIFDNLKDDLLSISDNGFKDIDAVVSSLLITLKYDIKNDTSIMDLYKEHEDDYLLKLLVNNKRYKNIVINNSEKIKDKDVQFGAMKIDIDGLKVISFQGTDGSIIGWKENFKIGYEYPTKTQKLAIKYLEKNMQEETVLVGHSKGGNLALIAALEANNDTLIKKIYNLDGPGFDKKTFDKAKRLEDKIITYVPIHSFVGVLMNNYNMICVKSESLGFAEHNMVNWYLDDYNLVRDELSKESVKAHEASIWALNNITKKDAKIIVEEFFDRLEKDNIKSKKDCKELSALLNDLKQLDISENAKKYYIQMFEMMLS